MAKRAPKKSGEIKPEVSKPKKEKVEVQKPTKATKKEVAKPKKEEPKPPVRKSVLTNTNVKPKVVEEKIGPSKTKRFGEDKYDKISEKAGIEKFKEMGQKVQNGTHQWAYYAIENDTGVGYHYYLKKS